MCGKKSQGRWMMRMLKHLQSNLKKNRLKRYWDLFLRSCRTSCRRYLHHRSTGETFTSPGSKAGRVGGAGRGGGVFCLCHMTFTHHVDVYFNRHPTHWVYRQVYFSSSRRSNWEVCLFWCRVLLRSSGLRWTRGTFLIATGKPDSGPTGSIRDRPGTFSSWARGPTRVRGQGPPPCGVSCAPGRRRVVGATRKGWRR